MSLSSGKQKSSSRDRFEKDLDFIQSSIKKIGLNQQAISHQNTPEEGIKNDEA
jgi:hypothetical protein